MKTERPRPGRGDDRPPTDRLTLRLPDWARDEVRSRRSYPRDGEKVALAVRLSRLNVEQGTGGPFGAAVFEEPSGRLIAVGVNAVLFDRCSLAHAEIMALGLAQRRVRSHRLNAGPGRTFVLASSAQPCAMCLGAVLWAGVDALLFGARRSDVERLTGFDEGPLAPGWRRELESRGLRIRGGIEREDACSVLRDYIKTGGTLY